MIARDISERKALEEQLEHRAFHDPLTGLGNRVFERSMHTALLDRLELESDLRLVLERRELEVRQGCDELQGFYLGRPVSAAETDELLERSEMRERAGHRALPDLVCAPGCQGCR